MELLTSCYQCVGLKQCYKTYNPSLGRDKARETAESCTLPCKGKGNDVIKVDGRIKGISRKKAQLLVEKGLAQWISNTKIKPFYLSQKSLSVF